MSNSRKTLPCRRPARRSTSALEVSLRHPNPPLRKTPSAGDRLKSMTPRLPRLSSSSNNDLRRSPKQGGRRSLPPPPRSPDLHDLAPPEGRAPNWLAHGRALSAALDEALRTGAPSPGLQACIERAYGAWNLDGVSTRQIAQVAHLARRAHDAIRGTSRSGLELAYADCARVCTSVCRRPCSVASQSKSSSSQVRSMRRRGRSLGGGRQGDHTSWSAGPANRARRRSDSPRPAETSSRHDVRRLTSNGADRRADFRSQLAPLPADGQANQRARHASQRVQRRYGRQAQPPNPVRRRSHVTIRLTWSILLASCGLAIVQGMSNARPITLGRCPPL
jgi:hypothetical protein